jgi:hypothetical protein
LLCGPWWWRCWFRWLGLRWVLLGLVAGWSWWLDWAVGRLGWLEGVRRLGFRWVLLGLVAGWAGWWYWEVG